ncbi:uncharacterized protein [Arachis hypogaea]|uniref:uncharacterized protein n=1 Tax=Arachis hypogaea TaxID=3818 RepID=UPI003B2164C6
MVVAEASSMATLQDRRQIGSKVRLYGAATHATTTAVRQQTRPAGSKTVRRQGAAHGAVDGTTMAARIGSISRFRDISKPFEEHFARSAIYLHDSDYLNTVKQGQHESLKDYMTCFTKIAISIPDLHPEVELHAIKSGLQPGKFQETITVAKPKTMAEFHEKAKGQIDIEELRQARKHDDIIKEILNSKLIKPPRKAGSYPDSKGTDRSKYCSFHQKHGHNTDDCVIAKDLLERLARQGHLDKYISGHMQQQAHPSGDQSSVTQYGRDRDQPNNSHPGLPTRTINCISGGFAGGGATSSARKRSYRAILSINADQSQQQPLPTSPQITFQTTDHDNSVANMDDPVVISLQLGDLLVKKVLLDPGSSADVLFYSTFQKIKLSNNVIQPSTGDLVGFSGERVLDNTITTIHSDAREARECYNNSLKRPNRNTKAQVHNIGNMNDQHMLADLDPRAGTLKRLTLTEDLDKIYFTENTDKFTYVSSTLSSEDKSSFRAFLQQNADLFAWTPADMPGIDPSIISHKLTLDPSVRPIAQKKINLGHDRKQASLEETKKLINAGFIREIRFTIWLANIVMVKKHNVDNASGFEKLNFMDAYFGYNQIQMHPSDQNKTAFITEYGNYCYKVMPFDLKNACATYQRLMDKIFAKQIGRNIENAELRYPSIEKLALALVFSARRLRPYFQSHEIHVRTDKPLWQVLQKPELAGRLVKWSVELSEFDIKYEGRASIKSQFLVDFITEFSVPSTTEDYIEWSLYVDGSSNPQGCGTGIILDDGHGNVIEHSLYFSFKANNNQSEYEALIASLSLVADLNITELKVYCDSLLIIQQHLPRESNGRADILSKLASTQPNGSSLYQSTLLKPSIELTQVLSVTKEADWRSPYIQRGFSRPLLKCLCRTEAELALAEAHEGICGTHLGARNNGRQFANKKFTSFLQNLKIKQHFSSVEHPQTNGLAEAANKVILHALRKKLDDAKSLWAELIPEIIWGYNTTIHSTTKETPFCLVYGSDAVIPVEISQSSLRKELADQTTQDIARQTELDLIEELRSSTAIKHLAMQ